MKIVHQLSIKFSDSVVYCI